MAGNLEQECELIRPRKETVKSSESEVSQLQSEKKMFFAIPCFYNGHSKIAHVSRNMNRQRKIQEATYVWVSGVSTPFPVSADGIYSISSG